MDKKNLTIIILSVMLVIAVAISIFALTKDTKTKYTISFNTDGGNKVNSQKIEEGEKVTKPSNPTKEGFEFLGWYLNGKYFDFETPIKEDITLEAKWKQVIVYDETDNSEQENEEKEENIEDKEQDDEEKVTKYTVKFDSNGGSSVSKQTVEKDKKATKPADPKKDGYIFKGWYLGSTKYDFSKKVTKNITLTAKWEKVEEQPSQPDTPVTPEVKEYTVKFDIDGQITTKTVKEGEKVSKPSNPTKDGYTFKYWSLNGSEYNFSNEVKSDITLKAEWKKNDVITYKIEDTNSVLNQQKLYILKNGEAAAGTVDIVNTSGKTVTRNVPVSGTTIIKGTYTEITNIKVN